LLASSPLPWLACSLACLLSPICLSLYTPRLSASSRLRIKEGEMEKKVLSPGGVLWKNRLAVLSSNRISFAKVAEQVSSAQVCLDYIPLEEVESVEIETILVATDINQTQV
jgi:hypothetical protein